MDYTETKNFIIQAKNICIIPSNYEPESLTSCLALFYTLKELNKNVNLIVEDLPEKLNFLVPSLDFISQPKNFVISIPRSMADISQIYYEKNEENLKIHLTVEKGRIKKENISFYFSDPKPDIVITLGIQDFQKSLENKLDSFGFLLNVPLLNIDNKENNVKFGQINLIESKSLSEIILGIIKSIDQNLIKKDIANCVLSGLVIYYENFKSKRANQEVFAVLADLVKNGANYQQIIDNLHKTTEKEINFLGKIFQALKTDDGKMSYAALDSNDFEDFTEDQASSAIEKIKTMGFQNDLLVLWKSHASDPMIKGFFYSKKTSLLSKLSKEYQGAVKDDWIFLELSGENIDLAKNKILNLL